MRLNRISQPTAPPTPVKKDPISLELPTDKPAVLNPELADVFQQFSPKTSLQSTLDRLRRLTPELETGDVKANFYYTNGTGKNGDNMSVTVRRQLWNDRTVSASVDLREHEEPKMRMTVVGKGQLQEHLLPERIQRSLEGQGGPDLDSWLLAEQGRVGAAGTPKDFYVSQTFPQEGQASTYLSWDLESPDHEWNLRSSGMEAAKAEIIFEDSADFRMEKLPQKWQEELKAWDVSPPELFDKVLDGSPLHTENLKVGMGHEGEVNFRTFLEDSDGDYAGNLSGAFRLDKSGQRTRKVAEKIGMILKPEHQGKDFANNVLPQAFTEFQQKGVDEIRIGTMEVGSYAWARFGFLPADAQSWDTLREKVGGRLEGLDVTTETRKTVQKILKSTNPRGIWELAALKEPSQFKGRDVTLGKALLLESGWDAKFAFDDPGQMKRFGSYVAGEV